jgi:hypothetical protein
MKRIGRIIKKVFLFYYEGIRYSSTGRKLFLVIAIKLFIMFIILKVFFFHDFLKSNFSNDNDRGNYVIEQLTKESK